MKTLTLAPKPLTVEDFAPFGDVIEASDNAHQFLINEDKTIRFHRLATVEADGGKAIINIFRSSPIELPFTIRMMERHPIGSQAFFPLGQKPCLIMVAPPGEFDPTQVEVFIAQPGQGFNFRKGVWHHYCTTLEEPSDFLVVDRGGEGHNLDEVMLVDDYQTEITVDF